MLTWFQALLPKEQKFFDLFEAHALTLVAGATSLRHLLNGGEAVPLYCAEVARHEEEADNIARDMLLLVRRTFITPFDRGDIKELINTLDDTIDQMHKTAKAVMLFEVTTLEPQMAEMGKHILRAAELTLEGVRLLASLRDNATRLNAIAEEIIRLEEETDTLNDLGIKDLFLKHRNGNAMNYIIGIEIYDHLEKVMDRFEDVANKISGLVIEQA